MRTSTLFQDDSLNSCLTFPLPPLQQVSPHLLCAMFPGSPAHSSLNSGIEDPFDYASGYQSRPASCDMPGFTTCQHQLMTRFRSSDVVLLYNTRVLVVACPSNGDDDGDDDTPANGLEMNVGRHCKSGSR